MLKNSKCFIWEFKMLLIIIMDIGILTQKDIEILNAGSLIVKRKIDKELCFL
jgi:hypothetical protein